MDIEKTIEQIRTLVNEDIVRATHSKDVEALKVKYLGRKGALQDLMNSLRECSSTERPVMGKLINDLKVEVTESLDQLLSTLEEKELHSRLNEEKIDISLPGRRRFLGRRHVVLKMLDETIDILVGMGFSVQYGPDIDTDYYNFEALNFAPDHPARDMQDTFYIAPDVLLRTHTSNTQVRVMESQKPPIRVIAPGKCYRNEDVSARSHVVFHQIEGLYIDEGVTFADLFATIEVFLRKLFKKEIGIRFRPSYFPFVEPGMEVDVECIACSGKGCSICKHSGWLEVLGAGMVHPEVLKSGGIDPEKYTGFAWGLGIERLALLRYSIPDIRLFMEDSMRFLRQF